jgi:hypothetical protein
MACVSKDTREGNILTYSYSPKIYCYTQPNTLLNKLSYNNTNYAQNIIFIYSGGMWFEYLSKQAALNRKFTYISLPFTENYVTLMDEDPLPSHSHPFKKFITGTILHRLLRNSNLQNSKGTVLIFICGFNELCLHDHGPDKFDGTILCLNA